jgi:TP901 family phage tail tape measure protein
MTSALATVGKIGVGVAAGLTGIAVESVKMASTFNAQMAMLNTQAGVSKNQIAGLSSGVLALAGQVGFDPTSLAEALFHVESSFASVGITGPQAMNILKVAAEGAAVGHANLVDVTNALDSAVVSGIPGVQDMASAMGVLNATVGAGDMTMQDLANAFSTGLLATVKGFGLSIKDVGAALAVFGDNNIRGAVAATDLRMAVMAMAKPASTASSELKKLGLSSDTLAKDMQTGGLMKALVDLKVHMDKAGVSAVQQGQVITDLFGKKAGTGLNVLIDQIDRVKSKYPDLTKGAGGFADAWETTKNTFAQQMKSLRAEADATAVRLGNFLLPLLGKALSGAQGGLGQIVSGFSGADMQPVKHPNLGNAFLNQDVAKPPDPTGWQKFGETVHRVLGEVEQDVVKLKPVGMDFVHFGEDAYQAAQKLLVAAEPVARLFGGALLLGVEGVGKALADVAGPAIKGFADFLSSHEGMVKFFADVILVGLITKMTVLGGIKAAQGVVGLATSIAQFPLSQTGQIKTAFDGLKTAWAGKEAKEGATAVTGLKGAITDLKGAATGALDKFPLFDSGKLAGLAKAGQDIKKVETAAADSEQLGLFETNMKGIVQVAETEQLALFEAGEAGVATEAETAAVSTGKLSGSMGKFALAGGMAAVLVGVGMLGSYLGHLAGVGDHTAISMDTLGEKLQLSGAGSLSARAQFTQTAVGMVAMDNAMSQFGQHAQGLKDVDTALAQLVTGGHAQDARSQFNDIAQALAKQGVSAQEAAGKFPQFERALKDAGDAAKTTDGQLSHMQDTLNAQSALTTFNSDLQTLKQQLHDSGHAMDSSSQAGLQNQRMFQTLAGDVLTYYQNQRTAGTGTADATTTMYRQTQQIEALGHQFGISKGDVDKFLGSLAGIKPDYSTTVRVRVDTSALTGFYSQMNNNHGPAVKGYDDGGFVGGAKGAAQLAIVHGGEYVFSNDMQSGRQPVDPRLLAGVSAGGGHGRSGGASAGGAPVVVNNITNVNVAGDVTSEDRLLRKLRSTQGQWSRRNGGATGWSATR